MNGGSRSQLIMKRMHQADRESHEQGQTDRQRDDEHRRAAPRMPPLRSHSVRSLALTTDASATTAPVDRSIPPAMITTAAPTASTPKRATRCKKRSKAVALKKGVIAIQEVDHGQDDRDARDQPPFRRLEEAHERPGEIGVMGFVVGHYDGRWLGL